MNTEQTEIVYNKKEYKYAKECYLKIREQIKKLSAEQKILKPQRKEDQNLKVPRTHSPYDALNGSGANKYNLRLLFIIYDEVRGKDERVELEKSKLDRYRLLSLKKLRDEYLEGTKVLITFSV